MHAMTDDKRTHVPSIGADAEKELRIVILEDVPTDAELVQRMLRDAGVVFSAKPIATKDGFIAELDAATPDLILSDYALPSFDGVRPRPDSWMAFSPAAAAASAKV